MSRVPDDLLVFVDFQVGHHGGVYHYLPEYSGFWLVRRCYSHFYLDRLEKVLSECYTPW